jgi:hypothetical protein
MTFYILFILGVVSRMSSKTTLHLLLYTPSPISFPKRLILYFYLNNEIHMTPALHARAQGICIFLTTVLCWAALNPKPKDRVRSFRQP